MPEQLFISFSSLPLSRYSRLELGVYQRHSPLRNHQDIQVKDRREMDSVKIKPLRRCSFLYKPHICMYLVLHHHHHPHFISSEPSSGIPPQPSLKSNVLQRVTFIMHVPFCFFWFLHSCTHVSCKEARAMDMLQNALFPMLVLRFLSGLGLLWRAGERWFASCLLASLFATSTFHEFRDVG